MTTCNLDNKLISAEDYEALTLLYGAVVETIIDTKQILLDAVYQVVMMDVCVPEVDLLGSFWNAYNLQTGQNIYPETMLNAVRTLNSHVLKRGRYSNLNDYLGDNGLLVSNHWQGLSEEVGFFIDDAYIETFIDGWSTFDETWFSFSLNEWYYFEID